ncbi:hypothetical protein [Maridesulfovibrio sp.]|uniref:hypothetical protein n=1 Tax=Maridesulfovibrio sp. TaxID=2795000 RepID=UPI0029CA18D2|nr:hypothetical protein [Maridesulfovibrio sp.]
MKKIFLSILAIFLLVTSAFAAPQVVTETHTYVLGDNDSKNDARSMCFLEAKRKMLEKAGILVMGHTQAESGMLTKDEINSYTAALIKVESAEEKWRFNESGSMVVIMTVRAVLDYDDIQRRLNEIQRGSDKKEKSPFSDEEFKKIYTRPLVVDFPDGSTLTFSPGTPESVTQRVCRYYWEVRSKK